MKQLKSKTLPQFPWDMLVPYRQIAQKHPRGIVDLSVGTPVDDAPKLIQEAIGNNANAHGYPQVWGTESLRQAIIEWIVRCANGIRLTEAGVLPVIGTKEAIGWLPTMLNLGANDVVVIPECAYPTYRVGAAMASTKIVACDDPKKLEVRPALIWLNSPANPHGKILSAAELSDWVQFARENDAILASDECYFDFAWTRPACSVLDKTVCQGVEDNLLVVQSTSKRSNMAGFRAGFIAGDQKIVAELLTLRKQLGMMISAPVMAALETSLCDDEHVKVQQEKYLSRRQILRQALETAGYQIDHSEGSLYLWATRAENCWQTTRRLAELGILVAPGDFYGPLGENHVRVGLTATDERIAEAANRLRSIN